MRWWTGREYCDATTWRLSAVRSYRSRSRWPSDRLPRRRGPWCLVETAAGRHDGPCPPQTSEARSRLLSSATCQSQRTNSRHPVSPSADIPTCRNCDSYHWRQFPPKLGWIHGNHFPPLPSLPLPPSPSHFNGVRRYHPRKIVFDFTDARRRLLVLFAYKK